MFAQVVAQDLHRPINPNGPKKMQLLQLVQSVHLLQQLVQSVHLELPIEHLLQLQVNQNVLLLLMMMMMMVLVVDKVRRVALKR
jgi:hypothetical protein